MNDADNQCYISLHIMKTVEEREALKTTATTKKTNKDRKKQGETEAIVKG